MVIGLYLYKIAMQNVLLNLHDNFTYLRHFKQFVETPGDVEPKDVLLGQKKFKEH